MLHEIRTADRFGTLRYYGHLLPFDQQFPNLKVLHFCPIQLLPGGRCPARIHLDEFFFNDLRLHCIES
jgi:hypothetical protein